MDRSFRQEINKETLNNTLDQLDLIDVYRVFHQKKKKKKKTIRFHFYLKRTWNILQDRSHPGSEI